MLPENVISLLILALVLFMFIFTFALMVLSITRWRKAAVHYLPPLKIEEFMCPRCGSKELEIIGGRTLRCRKCGTTFTVGFEERYFIWPFFWWFPLPLFWPVPADDHKSFRCLK